MLANSYKQLVSSDVEKLLKDTTQGADPISVLRKIESQYATNENFSDVSIKSDIFKALTLSEFEKGVLLALGVQETYITFCIGFMRELQAEYDCTRPSEKATAELVAINFARILQIQCQINTRPEGGMGRLDLDYLALLNKELDRANRQYIFALQMLKMLKQPALSINVKSQMAIVGQNQVIQSNTQNDKAK